MARRKVSRAPEQVCEVPKCLFVDGLTTAQGFSTGRAATASGFQVLVRGPFENFHRQEMGGFVVSKTVGHSARGSGVCSGMKKISGVISIGISALFLLPVFIH